MPLQQFTGVISIIGAQAFLQTNSTAGITQLPLLKGPSTSVGQQIAAAMAVFSPLNGTVQTVSGFPTNIGLQRAIFVP
jgi:hypothetical protein